MQYCAENMDNDKPSCPMPEMIGEMNAMRKMMQDMMEQIQNRDAQQE